MGTRIKLVTTFAVAGACAAVALPSMASAAPSGVTMHLYRVGPLKGFVFSPKPGLCAEGRTVKLYREKGKGQHPKRDATVAKTQAQSYHGRFKWTMSTSGLRPGNYYARVPLTVHCEPDNSKTSTSPRDRIQRSPT
jgi:hypothetical protein